MAEPSSKKLALFRAVAVLLVFFCLAGFSEYALRWRHSRIQVADRLAPGMVRHDSALGWRLAPAWSGNHKHYDFEAAYEIDVDGRRNDPALAGTSAGNAVLVLGDSFTFGLGVQDSQPFISLLNRQGLPGSSTKFLNFAVPGYSTDQELLFLEELMRGKHGKSSGVVLVVYLANDLLDNTLDFPLQLNTAKPYFELSGSKLVLRNSPVPERQKGPEQARRSLMTLVLGERVAEGDSWFGLENRSMLFKTVRQAVGTSEPWPSGTEDRLRPMVQLFAAIVDRMAGSCRQKGVPFVLVLLSGRSWLEEPGSLSAHYQEFFRSEIVNWSSGRGIGLIDLPIAMKKEFQSHAEKWYFPHDGHLNASGHEIVAGILRRELPSRLGQSGVESGSSTK